LQLKASWAGLICYTHQHYHQHWLDWMCFCMSSETFACTCRHFWPDLLRDRAKLSNIHSVHVHRRAYHIGGPTTRQMWKLSFRYLKKLTISIAVIALSLNPFYVDYIT